jgi:hypothetical protein
MPVQMNEPGSDVGLFTWLDSSNWPDFAEMVAAHYRANGHSAIEIGRTAPGRGSIIEFCKHARKTLVQCQPWNTAEAGLQSVRELFEMQISRKADRAVLITCGYFSPEAIKFAVGKPLVLVDGSKCLDLAQQFHKQPHPPQNFRGVNPAQTAALLAPSSFSRFRPGPFGRN